MSSQVFYFISHVSLDVFKRRFYLKNMVNSPKSGSPDEVVMYVRG